MRFVSFILLLAAAACAPETPETQAAAPCSAGGVSVSGAWVRAARAGQPMSAAYLTLCSAGGDRLTGVLYDGADATELHFSMTNEAGVSSMVHAGDGVPLPAGEPVTLAPGGAHVMLIGPHDELRAGERAALTLQFETAPPLTIEAEIRDAMAMNHGQ